MPTYEYECEIGHVFEVQQSIKDEPLEKCTQITGHDPGGFGIEPGHVCDAPCRRLISTPRFILKGGGWYSDGYSQPTPKKKQDKK